MAYLMIVEEQYKDSKYSGCYNVGPDDSDCITTGELVDLFCTKWNQLNQSEKPITWESKLVAGPHEASFLKLDCSKLKSVFHWKPRWFIDMAVEKTVEWTKNYFNEGNVSECIDNQIKDFLLT